MKKRGLLVLVLALVLIFAMSATALAEDISVNTAAQLAGVIDYFAEEDCAELISGMAVLTKDANIGNNTLSINGDIILDLNGYQLSSSSDGNVFEVESGSFYIYNNWLGDDRKGEIYSSGGTGINVSDYGSLYLFGGSIRGVDYGIYTSSNTAEIFIDPVHHWDAVKVVGSRAAIYANFQSQPSDPTIFINGGDIFSGNYAIWLNNANVVFGTDKNGILAENGILRIQAYFNGIEAHDSILSFNDLEHFSITGSLDEGQSFDNGYGIRLYNSTLTVSNSRGWVQGISAAILASWENGMEESDIYLTNGTIVTTGGSLKSTTVTIGPAGSVQTEINILSFATARNLSVDPLGEYGFESNASSFVAFGLEDEDDDDDDDWSWLPGVGEKKDVPYINGYPDGSFRPDGLIKRSEAAKMFAYAAGYPNTQAATGAYTDMSYGEWYHSYVALMTQRGVITGYEDNTFRADGNITRAEFVAMVCRLAGKNYTNLTAPYGDTAKHWANGYINIAHANGWLADFTDSDFNPDKAITRGEAVQILNKMLGRDQMIFVQTAADFSDVPANHPLYDAIKRASSVMK